MSSIASGFSDLGSAVSDLFGAEGSSQAASAYGTAANIATSNAALTQRSTAIQEAQANIQTYQALGTEQADVAGAGMTAGGSAGDLLRASTQQASLTKQLIENQGQVTSQGFSQQAAAYVGQQQAANTQAKGQAGGGLLSAVAGVASLASWIICTELTVQGRMPRKYWAVGTRVFQNYPEAVKQGYYVWAVPSVRHLRRKPNSLYSRFLCSIFNARAENIAAGHVPGARKLWYGAAVTVVLWPICYAIGSVLLACRRKINWKVLYAEH